MESSVNEAFKPWNFFQCLALPWKKDKFSVLNKNGSSASVQIKHNVQMRENCSVWEQL